MSLLLFLVLLLQSRLAWARELKFGIRGDAVRQFSSRLAWARELKFQLGTDR